MLVVQNAIGAFGLAPGDQFAAYDDAAFGKRDLATNLGEFVPAGLNQMRRDEFGADVGFAESFIGHPEFEDRLLETRRCIGCNGQVTSG
ncbi:hypothetical protein RI210_05590 [Methylomonas koyamae]|nr:hypothetical protein [Methylomonas koyamae]WNB77042.1 hypothetical protein RI210_05590 [Methylomonas koyamae]